MRRPARGREGVLRRQHVPGLSFNDAAVVSPWVSARPNDQVSARAALDLRLHGPASGHGLEPTTQQLPWSVRIRDAWVAARSSHTELRLGVQRIAWGEAQGISVVDTINPLNLEDPTLLDQRLSTLAATFTAHTETLSLTAVVVPTFVPAALPAVDDLMAGPTTSSMNASQAVRRSSWGAWRPT